MKLLHWISVALISATLSSRADLPEGWQLRDSPAANQLNGVTYGNDLFVAVGAGAIILTSPNGIDWTQRSAGTSAPQLFTIAYGGG